MYESSTNPEAAIQKMMADNPEAANLVFDLIKKHNGDQKAAFFDLAMQKGMNL